MLPNYFCTHDERPTMKDPQRRTKDECLNMSSDPEPRKLKFLNYDIKKIVKMKFLSCFLTTSLLGEGPKGLFLS